MESIALMKVALGMLAMVGVTVVVAYFLIVWISGLAEIRVTENETPPETPPGPGALVDEGAALLVQGEIETVHPPEWNTPDGSRPSTPWDVSSVPDDFWIHTPVTVSVDRETVPLQQAVVDSVAEDAADEDLRFVFREGEIGSDGFEIDDGQDREFESGDEVLLVLSAVDADGDSPELADTDHGPAWELMRRYSVDGDTATLVWGDETHEQPVDEVIDEFRDASR